MRTNSIRHRIYPTPHFCVTFAPTAEQHEHEQISAKTTSGGRKAATSSWFPTKAQEIVTPSSIEALWVRHILLQTHSLANEVFQILKRGERDFDEIARTLSDCMDTRKSGGEIGWAGIESDHLNGILDLSSRKYLLGHCKPGDTVVLETERGVHVVRADDVMTVLRSVRKPRRRLPGLGKQINHTTPAAPRCGNGSTGKKKNLVNKIHKKYFVET